MQLSTLLTLATTAATASAAVLWDGRFADYTTAADFDAWSWSSQTGSYQTYIYGNQHSETASSWLTLGNYTTPSHNLAKCVKVAITSESTWNSGPMLRTELIPQTDVASLQGFFHFSMFLPSVNPLSAESEHQLVFWESHDAEIKYGLLNGQTGDGDVLRFMAAGETYWKVAPEKDTWYNFAIETGASGGLYASTGAEALEKVWTGDTGAGGNEFHVGHLRLNGDGLEEREELYYAGVYVEDELTTAV
ncbi:hypothetical protein EDC01DRAFT_700260 [Geopyxis carbonaria]|nr:hypothetical protein EDC01DRAFT_700260 [Geopyxis carbonaria]